MIDKQCTCFPLSSFCLCLPVCFPYFLCFLNMLLLTSEISLDQILPMEEKWKGKTNSLIVMLPDRFTSQSASLSYDPMNRSLLISHLFATLSISSLVSLIKLIVTFCPMSKIGNGMMWHNGMLWLKCMSACVCVCLHMCVYVTQWRIKTERHSHIRIDKLLRRFCNDSLLFSFLFILFSSPSHCYLNG